MSNNKRDNTANIDALLASVTEEMLGGDFELQFQEQGLRVERILLELVRPDPIQPRRVLPESIHQRFHENRLTPSQALRELVQSAQISARQRGQPFEGLLDLLPDPEDDTEPDQKSKKSPEEILLTDLVNLAITIRDDGQVNPLTVVDVTEGVSKQFRIETGERRYWASWLLRDFIPAYAGDGMIPCITIPQEMASPFRQAKENTARSGLSAVAMARQAALLLLTVHGYELPAYSVNNDFYRQALDLDLRGKREYTTEILSAMGGISKVHFSRFKSLLRLSDEALDLADRYAIDEGKLRHVLRLSPEHHLEMLKQIIAFGLTSNQVKELCEQEFDEDGIEESDNSYRPSRQSLQFAKLFIQASTSSPNEIAQVLLTQENDIEIARARLQATKRLIEQVEDCLK
ncbi:MAG: ParB N-terminal domain-containing protein [Aggregatilineales bacterium]